MLVVLDGGCGDGGIGGVGGEDDIGGDCDGGVGGFGGAGCGGGDICCISSSSDCCAKLN